MIISQKAVICCLAPAKSKISELYRANLQKTFDILVVWYWINAESVLKYIQKTLLFTSKILNWRPCIWVILKDFLWKRRMPLLLKHMACWQICTTVKSIISKTWYTIRNCDRSKTGTIRESLISNIFYTIRNNNRGKAFATMEKPKSNTRYTITNSNSG